MKRTDDVYFFTLIDFLVQVFFFGLLIYVVGQAKAEQDKTKTAKKEQDVAHVVTWTGFSQLTELTDFLSKLAPPLDFRGWADFMSQNPKVPNIKDAKAAQEAIEFLKANGGVVVIKEKLNKYDKAYGLPPCTSEERNGKIVPQIAATLRVEDAAIAITKTTPEFFGLLAQLHTTEADVKRLTLSEFKARFGELRRIKPSCMYFVDAEVRTEFLAPMDTLQSIFRIRSRL